jgi:transposase
MTGSTELLAPDLRSRCNPDVCPLCRDPDRDGAGLVLDNIRRRFPWLELIWADGGYNAWQVEAAVTKVPLLRMEIVKRSDDMKGFVVPPRRWLVERTFSWFGRNRRIAKDFENLAKTLVTFFTLASIQLHGLRRVRSGTLDDTLLAAPDSAFLDPQQAALDHVARGRSDFRDATSRLAQMLAAARSKRSRCPIVGAFSRTSRPLISILPSSVNCRRRSFRSAMCSNRVRCR